MMHQMVASTGARLANLGTAGAIGISLVLAALLAWVDYLVGIEISFSIFYLVPILLSAWVAGWGAGIALSIACSVLWLLNDYVLGGHAYSSPAIPYWNGLVRLGFFTFSVVLLTRLREALRREAGLSATMTEMLSLVSHEFNNTLSSLHLALKLLREGRPPPGVDESEEQLYDIMERGHRRLNQTVANFLNLARMRSGRFVLSLRPTMVRRLVYDSVAILEPLSRSKGVDLRVEAPAEVHLVHADPEALGVVITNLIGNAVKYTPTGGRVTVRMVVHPGSPGHMQFAVEDTGIGIAPEDRERILTAFYRSEQGRGVAKGYGIGLKISADLLRAHGSTLDIESTPGRGSHFSFRLPLFEGKTPMIPAPATDQGV